MCSLDLNSRFASQQRDSRTSSSSRTITLKNDCWTYEEEASRKSSARWFGSRDRSPNRTRTRTRPRIRIHLGWSGNSKEREPSQKGLNFVPFGSDVCQPRSGARKPASLDHGPACPILVPSSFPLLPSVQILFCFFCKNAPPEAVANLYFT